MSEPVLTCSRMEGGGEFEVVAPAAYTVMGTRKLPIDAAGKLHWHIAGFSDDLDKVQQVGVFQQAFAEYQTRLYPWVFESTSDYKKADWRIFVAKENQIKLPSGRIIRSPYNFNIQKGSIAVQWEYYLFVWFYQLRTI